MSAFRSLTLSLLALAFAACPEAPSNADGGLNPPADAGDVMPDAGAEPAVKLRTTTATVAPGDGLNFLVDVIGLADTRVEWRVDEDGGGTVNAAGIYLAPNKTGVFHVRVISVARPDLFDLAEVTVTVAGKISLYPERARVYPGETFRFLALTSEGVSHDTTFTVTTANGGTISNDGTYVAPTTPGLYTVKVSKASQPAISDTSTVIVRSPTRKMTGTVTATTPLPGRVILQVVEDDQEDGTKLLGTVIDGLGPFTIEGFEEPGAYGLIAWVDATNSSNVWSAVPPQKTVYPFDFDGKDFNLDIQLENKPRVTHSPAAITDVAPLPDAALVEWSAHSNADFEEVAEGYQVMWGPSASFTAADALGTRDVVATGRNFLIVPGLSAAAPLYFKVVAKVNGMLQAPSAAFGPVTVGATRAGANLTINPSLFSHTVPMNGALWAIARKYDTVVPVNPGVARASACRLSQGTMVQPCQMSGLTSGNYEVTLFIDANGNGTWEPGERASNANERMSLSVVASQAPMTLPLALRDGTVEAFAYLLQRGTQSARQWAVLLWVSGIDETPLRMRVKALPEVQGAFDSHLHQEAQTTQTRMAWPNWRIYELGNHRPVSGEKLTVDVTFASGSTQTLQVPLPTTPSPFEG